MVKKVAVILFNLGGPNDQKAVQPFLFNLFRDKAIIRLPQPFRYLIAKWISARRAPIAREIYAKLNGGSPILKNTKDQALLLENELNINQEDLYKTFIAMRYWHPFAYETVHEVIDFNPDEVILLPLYPQFSTTTTKSSADNWCDETRRLGFVAPTKMICCYPQQEGFIRALSTSVRSAYDEAKKYGKPRILFSAHGLPEKIVKSGDPYQEQCMMTVHALKKEIGLDDIDSVLCFQSRVGPLKWIGPATDDEVRRAGQDKVPIIIAPIAFVSDHSETLVEIDIEYRNLAHQNGVPFFSFVRPVGIAPDFIRGLAQVTQQARIQKSSCASAMGAQSCSPQFKSCFFNKASSN